MTIIPIIVLSKTLVVHDPVVFSDEFAHRNWQILPWRNVDAEDKKPSAEIQSWCLVWYLWDTIAHVTFAVTTRACWGGLQSVTNISVTLCSFQYYVGILGQGSTSRWQKGLAVIGDRERLCHHVGHKDAHQGKDPGELRTTLIPEKQHLQWINLGKKGEVESLEKLAKKGCEDKEIHQRWRFEKLEVVLCADRRQLDLPVSRFHLLLVFPVSFPNPWSCSITLDERSANRISPTTAEHTCKRKEFMDHKELTTVCFAFSFFSLRT